MLDEKVKLWYDRPVPEVERTGMDAFLITGGAIAGVAAGIALGVGIKYLGNFDLLAPCCGIPLAVPGAIIGGVIGNVPYSARKENFKQEYIAEQIEREKVAEKDGAPVAEFNYRGATARVVVIPVDIESSNREYVLKTNDSSVKKLSFHVSPKRSQPLTFSFTRDASKALGTFHDLARYTSDESSPKKAYLQHVSKLRSKKELPIKIKASVENGTLTTIVRYGGENYLSDMNSFANIASQVLDNSIAYKPTRW